MVHVKLLTEDGFCDAVKLQDRDTFERYVQEASTWKRHSSAVASKVDLLRTKSLIILAILNPRKA